MSQGFLGALSCHFDQALKQVPLTPWQNANSHDTLGKF